MKRNGASALKRRLAGLVRRRYSTFLDLSGPLAGQEPDRPGSIHGIRWAVANAFLKGDGIEIGALHQPLEVPAAATVRYVDRMPAQGLRSQYPELAGMSLVDVDIIDNGEELATIGDETQDFVIANHFIEHCQNPLRTFQSFHRVLKRGGVLYLAVPDKRYTFDVDRPSTPLDHVMRDFSEGPEWSRRGHFEEYVRLVNKQTQPAEIEAEVRRLLEIDYSIHFHVWTAVEFQELVLAVQRLVGFELALFMRNGLETVVVLRRVH